MHTVAGVRPTGYGSRRLAEHLDVLDRLMREPQLDALTRLEARLGRGLARRALAVARDEGRIARTAATPRVEPRRRRHAR